MLGVLIRTGVVIGAAGLLSGCGLLIAANIYGEMAHHEDVRAGKAPAMALIRACQREALERGPDGDWVEVSGVSQACLERAGWAMSPDDGRWRRIEPPR